MSMKSLIFPLALLACSACAPDDASYCRAHAQGGDPACAARFDHDQARFLRDRDACRAKARTSWPDYLYGSPHYVQEDYVDTRGVRRTATVLEGPDPGKKAAYDADRRAITLPCMKALGWPDDRNFDGAPPSPAR